MSSPQMILRWPQTAGYASDIPMRLFARVLIVEDDVHLRRALKATVSGWQAEVDEAETVAEGLKKLTSQRPDLVILDVRLPDGSGVAIARASLQQTPRPCILAMSGEASRNEAFDLGAVGVTAFLEKPL